MKNNVLIVEDEFSLGKTLNEYLNKNDYHSTLATCAQEARQSFQSISPKVVLMDIGLPDGSGLDLAREFLDHTPDLKLIFLSAQNEPSIRVSGLEMGAQDYITKPFALKELMLRLERIMPRKETQENFSLGHVHFKPKQFELTVQDRSYSLAKKECGILLLLFQSQPHAVSREIIIDTVWGQDKFPSFRTVDNYIVNLRKCLENSNLTIQSIRGVGYKLCLKDK